MFPMKTRLPVLLAAALLMSGCTGMMHRYLIEDAEIAREGNKMAMLDVCVDRGLAPEEDVARYRRAQLALFSVSVHNRDLYERRYVEHRLAADAKSRGALRRICETARAGLSEATLAMQGQYAQAGGTAAQAEPVPQVSAVKPGAWAPPAAAR